MSSEERTIRRTVPTRGWLISRGSAEAHYVVASYGRAVCGVTETFFEAWTPQQHAGKVKLCEGCKRWAVSVDPETGMRVRVSRKDRARLRARKRR